MYSKHITSKCAIVSLERSKALAPLDPGACILVNWHFVVVNGVSRTHYLPEFVLLDRDSQSRYFVDSKVPIYIT